MNTDRPILVLGGSGLLGEALVDVLQARARACRAPARADVDLVRVRDVATWLRRERPAAVIDVAAFTDVARAELPQHREEVFRINRDVPAHLAAASAEQGLPFLFVSTDFVFDGRLRRPYREDDPAAPLQVYGLSKWEGERAVREAHPTSLVVRTSTLFGPGRRGRPHYVDAILSQARAGRPIAVVRTPVASPTYAPDLAAALVELLDEGAQGLVHVVNEGGCSRLELARAVVQRVRAGGRVTERAEDDGGPRRPAYCVLDAARHAGLVGRRLRSWQAALDEYLERRAP